MLSEMLPVASADASHKSLETINGEQSSCRAVGANTYAEPVSKITLNEIGGVPTAIDPK